MAKPGEYDFVPMMPKGGIGDMPTNTLSVGIFQWVYTKDGKNLKKSKSVYRVKGPANKWQEINERSKGLCDTWNTPGIDPEILPFKRKKSETMSNTHG